MVSESLMFGVGQHHVLTPDEPMLPTFFIATGRIRWALPRRQSILPCRATIYQCVSEGEERFHCKERQAVGGLLDWKNNRVSLLVESEN